MTVERPESGGSFRKSGQRTPRLIIVQRETAKTVPGGPDRLARVVWRTCRLICRLSGGRLTDAHAEVLYMIESPRTASRE